MDVKETHFSQMIPIRLDDGQLKKEARNSLFMKLGDTTLGSLQIWGLIRLPFVFSYFQSFTILLPPYTGPKTILFSMLAPHIVSRHPGPMYPTLAAILLAQK